MKSDSIEMKPQKEEEELWAKRFPPHVSYMEIEQLDEFFLLHQQIVANRIVTCCVDCAKITEISSLAVDKLNNDRTNLQMPLLCLVKVISATKQRVSGEAFRLKILFKLTKAQDKEAAKMFGRRSNDDTHTCSSNPVYFFTIYRKAVDIIDIKYEEISTFVDVPGGRWRFWNGNFIPKIGLQCSPLWSELEAEQWILVALEEGIRLFDTSFFGHNRGKISKAIKKSLPLFGLSRSDVFVSAKINIIRPETAKQLFMTSVSDIDEQQFHSVSEYAQFCVEQCVAQFDCYIDLCMVHYVKDFCKNIPNTCTNNRRDREEVYGVLEHYFLDIGTVRSIGVANFEPDHIEHLIKDGQHCVPAIVQCEIHPFLQRDDLLDYCQENGIFVQAHSIFAYKEQTPSYALQQRRYSLLKRMASFYKIGTSQLSLSYIIQRAPHIGAVFLEQTDDLWDANIGLMMRQVRKLLSDLVSSVVTNGEEERGGGTRKLKEEHMHSLRTMDLGKLGGGRFTKCEQWKVM